MLKPGPVAFARQMSCQAERRAAFSTYYSKAWTRETP